MSDTNISLDPASQQRLMKRLQDIGKRSNTEPRTEVANFLMTAGEELAKAIKKQPKELMPVITGRLRASVHAKHQPSDVFLYSDKNGEQFSGGLQEPIKEGQEVVVGTNVVYAFKVNLRKPFMDQGKRDFMPIFERNLKILAKKIVTG